MNKEGTVTVSLETYKVLASAAALLCGQPLLIGPDGNAYKITEDLKDRIYEAFELVELCEQKQPSN